MRGLSYWDRFAQQRVATLPSLSDPGRYGIWDAAGVLGPVDATEDQIVHPGGSCAVRSSSDQKTLDATLDATVRLVEVADNNGSAVGLLALVGEEDSTIVALERQDATSKTYLSRVMSDPATTLDRVDELVPVHSARRMTRRTMDRLSGHSEDWMSRTGSRIRPLRLQAERLDDGLDLHENRIAMRVITRLEAHYARRLVALDASAELVELAGDMREFSRWKRARVSTLWDAQMRTAGTDTGEAEKRELLQRLGSLQEAVMGRLAEIRGLRTTTLGKGLAWRSTTEPVRQTNLFSSHECYSHVAKLDLALGLQAAALDLESQMARARARLAAFDRYVEACVGAAAALLGERPHLNDVEVIQREDRTLRVTAQGLDGVVRGVTVIPVPLVGEDVRGYSEQVGKAWAEPVVVVAVGQTGAHHLGARGTWSLVELGPFALTGVEVLGAALRLFLEVPGVLAYPYAFGASAALKGMLEGESRWCTVAWEGRFGRVRDVVGLPALVVERLQEGTASHRSRDSVDLRPLSDAMLATAALKLCPVCGQQGRQFEAQLDASFFAVCGCRARWYVGRCPLGHRRAVIDLPEGSAGFDQWSPGGSSGCPECVSVY